MPVKLTPTRADQRKADRIADAKTATGFAGYLTEAQTVIDACGARKEVRAKLHLLLTHLDRATDAIAWRLVSK